MKKIYRDYREGWKSILSLPEENRTKEKTIVDKSVDIKARKIETAQCKRWRLHQKKWNYTFYVRNIKFGTIGVKFIKEESAATWERESGYYRKLP